MNDQNISWNERVQACCGHLFAYFLGTIGSIFIKTEPLGKPLSKEKCDLLEWVASMTIYCGEILIKAASLFVIAYIILSIWAKMTSSPFVKDQLQQARNFAETNFVIASMFTLILLFGISWGVIATIKPILSKLETFEALLGIFIFFLIAVFMFLWSLQVILAVIKTLSGKPYEYFFTIGLKVRRRKQGT